MNDPIAVAIVGLGAILPDAPDVPSFWRNIQAGRYSITEVPPERWRPDLYFDPDPAATDKTYSKIGGWVKGFKFDARGMGIAIPPRTLALIDEAQQWAIAASFQALRDYGYPQRPINPERMAVILGSALGGENHYRSTIRIHLPEYLDILASLPAYQGLSAEVRRALAQGLTSGLRATTPEVTEDTMPGELTNIIAGRVANVFNFSGPNFVTDAACASSLAALQSAVEGLMYNRFDMVLTGGVDRNMGPEAFVKFCKIGALSPDGSRPYAEGANGFVMGEGAAVFLLKRLVDAERDGDKIYAVVRGIGASSDGKGKAITAPNPIGQQRAIERAWKSTNLSPASAGLIEGHGTSTPVGDLAEVNSLHSIFGPLELKAGTIALGSVKSNFGHLKSSAGAAGLLKTVLALYDHLLPPSVNYNRPNAQIDFSHLPLYVNTQVHPWEVPQGTIRRAGVSAFGFGGTNFHVVVEEYLPGVLTREGKVHPVPGTLSNARPIPAAAEAGLRAPASDHPRPYRGLLFASADSVAGLRQVLIEKIEQAKQGSLSAPEYPRPDEISRVERLVIDYENSEMLVKHAEAALKALESGSATAWQALSVRGVYRGSGRPGKLAFLFPGQGSQYINMLRDLREIEPVVADTFREADAVMTPLLGKPLSSYIFVDGDDSAIASAELELRNTAITQPAILTVNVALLRLMAQFGYRPEFVIGHSLGEYAALVAAGVLTLAEALEVVAARGKEMSRVAQADNGCMAAVSAPLAEVEKILKQVDGYVVIANINSPLQSVIGGTTPAVEAAISAFLAAGFQATKIPVSHAFHTRIVAPASQPLRQVIARMSVNTPQLNIVANVTGKAYPTGREEILDLLAAQVSSPVQFVQGINTLYEAGARIFVEVGPKRVLSSLAVDILKEKEDVLIFSTNHPRKGGLLSFHEALCRLYAAGATGMGAAQPEQTTVRPALQSAVSGSVPEPGRVVDGRLPLTGSVVISGAGLGLPGLGRHVFDDGNILSILNGEMRIEPLPLESRQAMLEKSPIRLVKSEAGAEMQTIEEIEQTIKLAGQRGLFDPATEFGMPEERLEAVDISTQLAIAAGIEALRDAGIPLVMGYKQTSTGTWLPERFKLPEALADETGVIFGSAFPGLDRMADETSRFYESQILEKQRDEVRRLLALVPSGQSELRAGLEKRIGELESALKHLDYHFDRRFIFRVLSMGHSQFAEYIGARGPNTHVNAACATTTHAVALAEDWIRSGRARRVIVIAGDDVTSGNLSQWIATSLMASGAATTEGDLRLAALPFDRRRNGMIIGMAAAALVVESEDALRERGMRALAEVLATHTANSAYHGTRLNVAHVSQIMEQLLTTAEQRFGIRRDQIAAETVFVSHETYTPARGGSASAEIHALRDAFGKNANQVVIANTKGFTGHTMGVGVEDVVAVKALEYGIVPPIANIEAGFEPDPELGDLNLSHGGKYPVQYALRLGAGFGSQIAMTLLRKIPGQGERIERPIYQRWLSDVTGYPDAELEVVQRTLRIRSQGVPALAPARSRWQYGQGPTLWAASRPVPAEAAPVQVVEAGEGQETAALERPAVDPLAIKAFLLSAVSAKTGYPEEVLDLDLDLEADLGIDTVKQAELFAAIREHYGIPRREDLRLTDYNTLAKVITFIEEGTGRAGSTPALALPGEEALLSEVRPVPTVATAAAHEVSVEEIRTHLLGLVSEKTGYPPEVLDLDLDLEADLGIDTVKQAELFAAIRDRYAIPRREDLRLADYNTLARVIQFVQDSLKSPAGPFSVPPSAGEAALQPAAASAAPRPDPEAIRAFLLSLVSEKTGYPVEVLDLDLDLEADLGIDTVKQAELFASVRAQYDIPRREDLRLSDYNTLAKIIAFVSGAFQAESQPVSAPVPDQPVERREPRPAPARASVATETEIKAYVLSAVSQKTGYPVEVLDPDLDLEADLGVDTVKQAELLAAIRAQYDIPRREDLRLSDYNTLSKVIAFVLESLRSAEQTVPASVPEVSAAAASSEPDIQPDRTAVIRRVPVPALRARLDLCLPTGVTLDASSRVLVVGGPASEALTRSLKAHRVKVLHLDTRLESKPIADQLTVALKEGPLQGVYFLSALEVEPGLGEMTLADLQTGLEDRLYRLYAIMRSLPEQTFLICATRLGGLHGYSAGGASAPLGGGVSGFAKALARERPESLVKVVDFGLDASPDFIAAHLMDETLRDPGSVEIGWENGLRYGIAMVERPLPSQPDFALETGSVFLISGGSSSILPPIVDDLAKATRGSFYLLDRSALPDPAHPDLDRLRTDRDGLKVDLIARASAAGRKVTPVQVEQTLQGLERSAALLATLQKIEERGGKARYLACDITDPVEVDKAVREILQAEGRVDVFLHMAGFERSRKLESKPLEEFRQVVAVKVEGFFNIFKAMQAQGIQPRAVVAFSSVAGRFGNSGQTDYSAANDLLCKITSNLRGQYPAIKAVAIDWSAWAGIGMASRGNTPALMKLAGIDMVEPSQAAPLVRAELLAGSGETVLAGSLGLLLDPTSPNDGVDLERADQALREGKPIHTMLSHLAAYDLQHGLVLEAELDPRTQPFLRDHAMDGVPVLPGVMGIEGFSIAAKHISSILASDEGRLSVSKLEDIQFLTPFKFYRNQPRRIQWIALALREATGLVVYVSLESTRVLMTKTVEHLRHFTGKVILERQASPVKEMMTQVPNWNGAYTVKAEDIYRLYFHGPAFQVLEGVQRSGETVLGKLNKSLPAFTGEDQVLLSTPTLVELCFQTAGIWEVGKTGILALPRSIQSLTLYRQSVNGDAIYAEVKPGRTTDGALSFDARVVDAHGRLYLELKDYRTSPLPYSAQKELLTPLRGLFETS